MNAVRILLLALLAAPAAAQPSSETALQTLARALEAEDVDAAATASLSVVEALAAEDAPGDDQAEMLALALLANLTAPRPPAVIEALLRRADGLPAEPLRDELPDLVIAAALRMQAAAAEDDLGAWIPAFGALARLVRARRGLADLTTARAFGVFGSALGASGHHPEARDAYRESVAAFAAAPEDDWPNEGAAYENLAEMLALTGAADEARAAMQRSLALRQRADATEDETVHAWRTLGEMLRHLDDPEGAARALRTARSLEAARLGDDALAVWSLGCEAEKLDATDAPFDCERALTAQAIALPADDPVIADAHLDLGRAFMARAAPGRAVEHFSAAVEALADPDAIAEALRQLAGAEAALGAIAAARAHVDLSLAWFRALDGEASADALIGLHDAAILAVQADDQPAARAALDALAAHLAVDPSPLDAAQRASIAYTLAVLRAEQNAPGAAQALLEAVNAVEATVAPGHAALGPMQARAAQALLAADRRDEARALARRALIATERAGDAPHAWEVFLRYGLCAYTADHNTVAIFFAKRAVDALQRVRADVDPDAGAALFTDAYQAHYRALIDLLVEESGRLAEAQVVAGLLREAEFARYLGRGAPAGPAVPRPTIERTWLARYDAAVADLRAAARAGRATAAESRFAAALDALEADMQAAEHAARRRFDAESVGHLAAQQANLAALGEGTVLLTVILTNDQTHLLITDPAQIRFASLPIGRAEVNALASALQTGLATRGDWRAPAAELEANLWRPIRPLLAEAGARTLLVSLDGALRAIPLAALYNAETGRFLIEDFPLVRVPETGFIDPARPRRRIDRVLAFGATAGWPALDLAPLPAVGREVEAIVRRAADDPDGALPGVALLDADFTARSLGDGLAAAPPAVHLASHFVFRPGAPADSFLVPGDGRPLGLDRLADLPFTGVELLTLSACQTAVGTFAEGQPLDSFAALALQRGVATVVASLWPVADDGAARLMARFYAALAAGVPRAEALRRAQLALLHGEEGLASGPARKVRVEGVEAPATAATHPGIWAPFVLIGDPR